MTCAEIRERLADSGEKALEDSWVKEHLETCAPCRKFMESLAAVDAVFQKLPQIKPSAEVIQRTVGAVSQDQPKSHSRRRLRLALLAGAPAVVVVLVGIFFLFPLSQKMSAPQMESSAFGHRGSEGKMGATGLQTNRHYSLGYPSSDVSKNAENKVDSLSFAPAGTATPSADTGLDGEMEGAIGNLYGHEKLSSKGMGAELDGIIDNTSTSGKSGGGSGGLEKQLAEHAEDSEKSAGLLSKIGEPIVPQTPSAPDVPNQIAAQARIVPAFKDGQTVGYKIYSIRPGSGWDQAGVKNGDVLLTIDGQPLSSPDKALETYQTIKDKSQVELELERKGEKQTLIVPTDKLIGRLGGQSAVKSDEKEIPIERLKFIPAQGYFTNTYLPGDPELEWLKSKLASGIFLDGRPLALERLSQPYQQLFDPPASEGLSVALSADHSAVEGPERVILQVGIKGSRRHESRRSPMNIVLVVDLRKSPLEEHRRNLWALADALAANVQAGDRFSLVVAGLKKPEILKSAEMDITNVRRTLAQVLEQVEKSESGAALLPALDAAYRVIRGEGALEAPLGVNLVIFASAAAPAEGELDPLRELAHEQALEGISLSTIGVGNQADMGALGTLALAGQGRRRFVSQLEQAQRALESELAASGRVVARAVRVRIRLNASVKLVQILGSQPLSEVLAERARKQENAIDRRLEQTTGIAADRGEDEDGIQIVIPAFYANDDHVILLDVVVPGPGPVADVRVRYKDMVNLRNSAASSSLNLPLGEQKETPQCRAVQKNVLASRISQHLLMASQQLELGNVPNASESLHQILAEIEKMRSYIPQMKADPEIERDIGMVAEYMRVLEDSSDWKDNQEMVLHLARSLAFAGKVKLPPGIDRQP